VTVDKSDGLWYALPLSHFHASIVILGGDIGIIEYGKNIN